VAGSSKAFQRLLRIAAVPTAAFLVFAAVWLLDRWGVLSAATGLHVAGGLGFPGFAAVSAAIAARRGRGRQRQAWLVMTLGLVALVFGAMTVLCRSENAGQRITLSTSAWSARTIGHPPRSPCEKPCQRALGPCS
jgi:hypothetical protein